MRLAFLSALLACAACGTAADAVDTVTEAKTATLHGTWRDDKGVERPATIHVEQRRLSAELTIALDGHACLANDKVRAELTTGGLETDADIGRMHLSLKGSLGLDDIVGSFREVADGPCEHGWVNVVR